LNNLEKGQVLVRLPPTSETREVAVFSIVRLDVPAAFFVEHVRDIATFKKGENVLQIGRFSNPPRLEDLAGLTLENPDIEALRRCQVNSCDMKLSAAEITRFRKEINWSVPQYRDRVNELARQVLLENVQEYLKHGNASLGEYNDKGYKVRADEELLSLLAPAPYLYDYVPAFQAYLEKFPIAKTPNTEDFVYWSKEKFGMKPVITLTHTTIYNLTKSEGSTVLIASKGIYASHYFEASLGLSAFIEGSPGESVRTYLIYINRSRADALRGLFGGLKRAMISGSIRTGTLKNMQRIKDRLEADYRR